MLDRPVHALPHLYILLSSRIKDILVKSDGDVKYVKLHTRGAGQYSR